MSVKKNDILFFIAIVAAIWFAISSAFWVYLFNVFLSFPFGLLSFLIWLYIRKDEKTRNKWVAGILIFGIVVSVISFVALVFYNKF